MKNSKSPANITAKDTMEISFLNRNTIVIQNDTSIFDVIENNTIKLILNSDDKRRKNYADFKFELLEENKITMYDLIFSDTISLERVAVDN